MTSLTAPGFKVQGQEFYLTGGRRWSGSIPLRGFYGLRSRFFFFFRLPTSPTFMSWTNRKTGATARVKLFVLVFTRPGHRCSHSSCPPPSDDQLGPAGLSPLLPMKRIISTLRTCATLGLAVDLQTRQVVPPPSPSSLSTWLCLSSPLGPSKAFIFILSLPSGSSPFSHF